MGTSLTNLIFLALAFAADGPGACPQGKHWVSAYHQGDYVRADGTLVRAHEVSAHCRTNPKGYEQWHSKIKTGRPRVWRHHREVSSSWTISEIERLLEAISELPDGLLEHEAAGIYRMKQSDTKDNSATTNDPLREVVLYDSAFLRSSKLARIVAHELAHLMFVRMNPGVRDGFLEAAKWIKWAVRGPTLN